MFITYNRCLFKIIRWFFLSFWVNLSTVLVVWNSQKQLVLTLNGWNIHTTETKSSIFDKLFWFLLTKMLIQRLSLLFVLLRLSNKTAHLFAGCYATSEIQNVINKTFELSISSPPLCQERCLQEKQYLFALQVCKLKYINLFIIYQSIGLLVHLVNIFSFE